MSAKKVLRALIFPPIAITLCLIPVAAALLIYSMLHLESTAPIRIFSYALSFYTLSVFCVKIPSIVRFFVNFKNENRLIVMWVGDPQLRVNVTLVANVAWNGFYGALQLGLGIYHRSAWFYSLFVYYAALAIMRLSIALHTLRHKPGEKMRDELARYRVCGWIFLIMNIAMSAMIFGMISQNRTARHSEITTIAMATYTFTSLTFAIVNLIKYRKYNSPAMSAAKVISLASACVSMLTLENTMLSIFGADSMTPKTAALFLALSGGAVSVFIIIAAIYMIVKSSKQIKHMRS